jgi:hypothetical protein
MTYIYCTSLLLLPLAATLGWMLFNYFFLWLGPDFLVEEELLDQAHVFKVILVTGMYYRPPMNMFWL